MHSLSNLNGAMVIHRAAHNAGGSTLSLNERYLIDEIEKTPVLVTNQNQTASSFPVSASFSVKTLHNMTDEELATVRENRLSGGSLSISSVDLSLNNEISNEGRDVVVKQKINGYGDNFDATVLDDSDNNSERILTINKNKPSDLSYSSSLSSTKSTHSTTSLSISPSPSSSNNSDEVNRSSSGSSCVVSLDSSAATGSQLAEESTTVANVMFRNANILLNDLLIDDDEDDEGGHDFGRQDLDDEDDDDRRETLIFKQTKPVSDISSSHNESGSGVEEKEEENSEDRLENADSVNTIMHPSGSVTSNLSAYAARKQPAHSLGMACEVASLSSVYSNYSQFDFHHQHQHQAFASPASPTPLSQDKPVVAKNDSFSSVSSSAGFKKPSSGIKTSSTSTTPLSTLTSSQSNSSSLSSFLG
jgi:hypothetical protein